MKQAFEILRKAVEEAKKHPDMHIEVVDCNMGFTEDGHLTGEENAPIQVRLVAYPRHAGIGSVGA